VVAHTAWFLPLGSPFAGIRQACLGEFRRCLLAAHRIGATVMNTHFNKPPSSFSSEQAIAWHVEVLGPLREEAAALGVTIVVGHVPFGGCDQHDINAAIPVRMPLLRFHLDSGHAKLERRQDRWDQYLDQLGKNLLHVHLSENDGTADQHLPLGSSPRGATDWPAKIARLRATGYDGTITLEDFSPQREHLLLSRDLLRKWWDGPDQSGEAPGTAPSGPQR
jgi:sugar phosphate isomerase/epimerase